MGLGQQGQAEEGPLTGPGFGLDVATTTMRCPLLTESTKFSPSCPHNLQVWAVGSASVHSPASFLVRRRSTACAGWVAATTASVVTPRQSLRVSPSSARMANSRPSPAAIAMLMSTM